MPQQFRCPTGTFDILPEEVPLWLRVEQAVRAVCSRFGYSEIRPPVFEYTPLFARSTGETTDIVEKEMYTIPSSGGAESEPGKQPKSDAAREESLTLRPELTPGVVRAVIEHNLFARRSLQKLFYYGPLFRRERPQKGRFRQFHQMGIEALGSYDALLDVETIRLATAFLEEVGVRQYEVLLNSMGCAECRATYRTALHCAAQGARESLCDNCRARMERNVFRILDCKVEKCVKVSGDFPPITDFLCEACQGHLSQVKNTLQALDAPFRMQPRLVRGLDYYTRTVYELTCPGLGAQAAVGGGGRYDDLIEQLGGPKAGAVGFAIGIERTILAVQAEEELQKKEHLAATLGQVAAKLPEPKGEPKIAQQTTAFVATLGDAARRAGFLLLDKLRKAGIAADMDYEGKSLKAQMRLAGKLAASFVVVIGEDELRTGTAKVRDMANSSESEKAMDNLVPYIAKCAIDRR